ncbi:MAG: CDP-diacylglycerol--serine O-phosphatidyltransferase [Holosporaceae bacterium]|jgi:CDP-diacylglycerol--serine O-phosphatidyltransferase|nr:CDP-diacylglycerol--serine O-phosphatidyltransferase [Holosporaceae bacterium]
MKKSRKDEVIIETEEIRGEETLKKRASLVRFLPSTITILALCVGLTSIRFALFHRWELATLCIFVSAVLDALDGRVARLLGYSSPLGAQLDSLSDLICFGVAPAVILFLKSIYLMENVGWGVCMFFTVCCALRLARFNVDMQQDEQKQDWEKKYFKGVPAPAGAILAISPMIIFFQTGSYAFLNPGFVSWCLLMSGVLMISSIRTFSSKMIEVSNSSAPVALLAISFFIISVITEVWLTLSILIVLYLLSIPYGIYRYTQIKNDQISNETVKEASSAK